MGQDCRICSHNKRLEIDRALVSGKSKASIAKQFGILEASLSLYLHDSAVQIFRGCGCMPECLYLCIVIGIFEILGQRPVV